MNHRCVVVACVLAPCILSFPSLAGDPWADEVIAFEPGTGAAGGFDDPAATLGEPSRMTGFASPDQEAVTPFNPPYHNTQIVSIGAGGSLTVRFDEPITDDPANPFGIDLIVFGNAFFVGAGTCGSPCGVFSEGGLIEVSSDGETWLAVSGEADGPMPTNGWSDLTDPYADTPGAIASNFSRPIDPALTLDDFAGLDYEQMQALYAGSGGGFGIDLAEAGLDAISYVRISNPDGFDSPEIDSFADVSPVLAGDVTGDGVVGLSDLLAVIGAWGETGEPGTLAADTNGDGAVDLADLLTIIGQWGAGS